MINQTRRKNSTTRLPKVSIITVNYNGLNFLKNFFASLKKLNYPDWELVFVDNASTDGSAEFLKGPSLVKDGPFKRLRLIENKTNLGFALANNQAVETARGKYLFFLNNDTKIDSKAILKLVSRLEKEHDLAIGGCRMKNYTGKKHFHTGIGVDIFGYPVLKGETFYVEGSALMIEKQLFEKIGGFDPDYFMFHEDIDLAWRVWLLGCQVKALPEAVIYHHGGGTAGGGEKQEGKYRSSYLRRYYSERNNIRTLLKNYQTKTLILILPLYFLLNGAEIVFCLVRLKFKVAFLYLKAYLWNLVNFKKTLKLRAEVQKNRVISDRELMKKMYFGSGKIFALKKAGIPEFQ